MKIYLPDSPAPDERLIRLIDDEQPLKFVAFGQPDDGVASVFPHDYQHDGFIANIRTLVDGLSFQGAGRVFPHTAFRGARLDIGWGSSSCKSEYGHDRPADAEVARRIEDGIRETIERIVREIMSKRAG